MGRLPTTVSRSWPQRPLASVAARVFAGVAARRRGAADASQQLPIINVGDLRDGLIAPLEELSGPPIPSGARTESYRVQTDDVVLTSRGTRLKVARVTSGVAGAAISSNLIAIRLGEELLAPVLFAYLQGSRGQAALMGRSRSSTISLALSAKGVGRLLVPVPPMEVQRQIADLVRAAEDNYAAALRAAEQRRAVAHAVASDLLSGSVPNGREE
ncbi:MAG: hypothetical protein RID81_00110 [Sandaracinaceae bacterium]